MPEFLAIPGDKKRVGKRLIDGIIIKDGPKKISQTNAVDLTEKDIIVVQTKGYRLGMYLMGQAFFSRKIMKRYEPRSIETVAICAKGDEDMEALCGQFDIAVEVISD